MNNKFFLQVEKKYKLYDLHIKDFYFWRYYRNNIITKYEKQSLGLGSAHIVKKNHISVKESLLFYIKKIGFIVNFLRLFIIHGSVLVLNHPRKVLIDGKYIDIYTDELTKRIKDCVIFEKPYQNTHMEPTDKYNLVYTDIVDFFIRIYSVFYSLVERKKLEQIQKDIMGMIKPAIEELDEHYDIKIDLTQLAVELKYNYLSYKVMKSFYLWAIKKINPKVIVEVVSYSDECMVVNEIAKKMGISTIELQHGCIGVDHLAYNYCLDSHIDQFPDYLFLFSDIWKRNMQFPIKEDHIVVTGYPYLEQQYHKYKRKKQKQNGITNILFLSSGPIARQLEDIVVQLDKLLGEDYHIIYKLHPGEYAGWDKRYTKLAKLDDVEVISDSKKNLYELLSQSDIQISGYNSTTIFEGLIFGLPTYILDYCMSVEVEMLCNNGYAISFQDANELYTDITSSKVFNKINVEEIWKSNAIENMIDAIERVQNNR